MFERESARRLNITPTTWHRLMKKEPDLKTPSGRIIAVEKLAVALATLAVAHAQIAAYRAGGTIDDITTPPLAAVSTFGGEGALYNAVDDSFLDTYRVLASRMIDKYSN